MTKYGDRFINRLIGFDYYGSSYYAVCVGRNEDGKLICYRARKQSCEKAISKSVEEMFVKDPDDKYWGYVVEYMCKFNIHPGCVRKDIVGCDLALVNRINQRHDALTPLKDLIKKYKEMKTQYLHTFGNEKTIILRQIGKLNREITARQAAFLESKEDRKKTTDKYRNFRVMPDKKGVNRMYKGGSCSGK